MQIYGPSQLHGPQGINAPHCGAGRLSPPPGPRPRRSPTKSTSPKPLSSSSRSSSFPTSARIAWQRFASRSPPARTRPATNSAPPSSACSTRSVRYFLPWHRQARGLTYGSCSPNAVPLPWRVFFP